MISLNKIKILFLELKSNKYQPTELFYEVSHKTYLTGNKKKNNMKQLYREKNQTCITSWMSRFDANSLKSTQCLLYAI